MHAADAGKPGTVAELKPGMRVGLSLSKDRKAVIGIREVQANVGRKNGDQNNKDDAQQDQNDDGQKNQKDDGQKNQKDDGQQNQKYRDKGQPQELDVTKR